MCKTNKTFNHMIDFQTHVHTHVHIYAVFETYQWLTIFQFSIVDSMMLTVDMINKISVCINITVYTENWVYIYIYFKKIKLKSTSDMHFNPELIGYFNTFEL